MFGSVDYSQPIVHYGENFDVSQFGQAALFGGSMVLIGMVTVFAVLCILWGCLVLFKVAFHDMPAKKAAEAPDTVKASPMPVTPAASSNDEIVAVIAAAIAMAESENSGMKFRVVSFRRK